MDNVNNAKFNFVSFKPDNNQNQNTSSLNTSSSFNNSVFGPTAGGNILKDNSLFGLNNAKNIFQ